MKIILKSVEKWYNHGRANEVHALQNVSFSAAENEVICIQGPSGSGKSTLLSIIGCLFPPTSGLAEIDGKRLSRLPDRYLTLHRRRSIGFIFQRFQLIPDLSVEANIILPLLPLGMSPDQCRQRSERLMELFSISHRRNFPITTISGGELQRTAIARALILDPPIILADEPTAHLDTDLSMDFMDIVKELKKRGKTVIITSHDPLVSRHSAVNRCLTLRDGSLRNGITEGQHDL
jgi:putative ABC transport system ATP-binding protein